MLDEPFAALDAFPREELWCVIRDLQAEKGITTVLFTHDLREAVFLAGRVLAMSARPGRILGNSVWVDLDEPAAHGRFVGVRDRGHGGETVVRLLIKRNGRRTLRAFDERCPERTVDAGNETDIRGVVVLVGRAV